MGPSELSAAVSTRPSTRPLTAALSTIPDTAWTAPSNYQDNRIHHLYQRCEIVRAGLWDPAGLWDLVPFPFLDLMVQLGQDQGALVHDAWLSRIAPGGYIVPHTDASRWRERWHIPIQTAGWTYINHIDDVDHVHYDICTPGDVGVPFQVQHWLPHSVENNSDRDRIHLVIDLDRYVGPDESRPFVIP